MTYFLEHIDLALGGVTVAVPFLLLALLGLRSLFGGEPSETTVNRLVAGTAFTGLVGSLGMLAYMLATGRRRVPIDLGLWASVEPGFELRVKFVFDRLSVPMAILTFALCGTIGAFAGSYLHREPGFKRFFTFYAIFLAGMTAASLAGTIETLFAGWEMVGLSSALLIAFFQDRAAPARSAFHVWVVYRLSDAALVLAAVVMHSMRGAGDFDRLLGAAPWPDEQTAVTARQAFLIGGLLLFAAAGKSALAPFCGWLPRAMEGPTPSSAVFYGALSVHLGAYLLLRISPFLDVSPALAATVTALGLVTSLIAYLSGRVQTDIKTVLAYASLQQVGVITAEIGLGFRYLALVHLLGHASVRTLQLLRAPSLLQDYQTLENAVGGRLPAGRGPGGTSASLRAGLYRFGFERGFTDAALMRFIVEPFRSALEFCRRLETTWLSRLRNENGRRERKLKSAFGEIEDYT